MCLLSLSGSPSISSAVTSGKSLSWPGGGQGTVVFKGKDHAKKGLTCDACHPSLFQMSKGAAKMTMKDLNEGRFCGSCHNGRHAFGVDEQRKCHKCHKGQKKEKKGHHHEKDHKKHHDRHHDDD